MEDTNQTDNEKNDEDETESTCDKDEGVTEKSEEEVSSPLYHVKQTVFH